VLIQNEEHHHAGAFYIEDNGKRVAEMSYYVRGTVMTIYHTEVDKRWQGLHLGEQLVEAGANYARQNQLKVRPTCIFARAVFERTKEYQDLLAA
jgi:uncharacterized protein